MRSQGTHLTKIQNNVTNYVISCMPSQGTKLLEACDAAGVRAFPTWVINGRSLEGEFTIEALAKVRLVTCDMRQQRTV